MRVELAGVHRVKRRLANGSTRVHFYAWRGGPSIDAEPGTAEFIVQYNEAHRDRRKPEAGTLLVLVAEFKESAEFKGLADKTRKDYLRYLRLIEEDFGDLPIAALNEPEVRGEFKSWRDKMTNNPRKADYAWTVLARVLSVAKDRGRIPVNPCERGGRLYKADRTEKIWQDEHIAAFEAVAAPELRLALMLALWTGQRQGDMLRLSWSDYDGKKIRLKQSKGKARVPVTVGAPLRKMLDAIPQKNRKSTILVNTFGETWTGDGFRTSFRKAQRRAKLIGLTFHDLRGSAVTRLALVGCTPQEIASVTGHSLKTIMEMLDRHYLGDRVKLGEQAIRRLERKQSRKPSVVKQHRQNPNDQH